MSSVSFSVRGKPVTQGSKTAAVNRHTGRAVMREVNGSSLSDWRLAIASAAREAMGDRPLLEGPIKLTATFRLRRPKSLPKRRRVWPVGPGSGDLDKYMRALGDAMSSVVYTDDGQLVDVHVLKDYAPELGAPGVDVFLQEIV